jgi:hypothetical protein
VPGRKRVRPFEEAFEEKGLLEEGLEEGQAFCQEEQGKGRTIAWREGRGEGRGRQRVGRGRQRVRPFRHVHSRSPRKQRRESEHEEGRPRGQEEGRRRRYAVFNSVRDRSALAPVGGCSELDDKGA